MELTFFMEQCFIKSNFDFHDFIHSYNQFALKISIRFNLSLGKLLNENAKILRCNRISTICYISQYICYLQNAIVI